MDTILSIEPSTPTLSEWRFSLDGGLLAGVNDHLNIAEVFDASMEGQIALLEDDRNGLEFSPNGRVLLRIRRDNGIVLWDAATQNEVVLPPPDIPQSDLSQLLERPELHTLYNRPGEM